LTVELNPAETNPKFMMWRTIKWILSEIKVKIWEGKLKCWSWNMRDWELGLNVDIVWSGLYVDGKSTGKLWFEHLWLNLHINDFQTTWNTLKGNLNAV